MEGEGAAAAQHVRLHSSRRQEEEGTTKGADDKADGDAAVGEDDEAEEGDADAEDGCHPWARYVNPVLAGLYAAAGLDKRFVRAEGLEMIDANGRRYVDFLAGYGSLPLGHHPPDLWRVVFDLHDRREPVFSIPAILDGAGALAKALIRTAAATSTHSSSSSSSSSTSSTPQSSSETPSSSPSVARLRYAMFANSGSEAVEWAIKLARTCKRRLGILSTWNSYHGKTLGALSASGRTQYHGLGVPAEGFDFVTLGDSAALRTKLEEAQLRGAQYAAFLMEPIQGEGGIVIPPEGYLQQVRALCTEFGVILIADEIQTGLGRTGRLFAYQHENIVPDIVALSKALSGGMYPIGAIMYTEESMSEEFLFKQSSTFAGGALGCRIGLRTLQLITENDGALMRNAKEMGGYLMSGIEELRASDAKFERILTQVRGRGLMIGIEFCSKSEAYGSAFLGVLAQQKILGVMISSYMLNVKGVRLANALNKMNTLRVQPALTVTREACDTFLSALRHTLELLAAANTAALMAHLVGAQPEELCRSNDGAGTAQQERSGEEEVSSTGSSPHAFIVCARSSEDWKLVDPSFESYSPSQIEMLATKLSSLLLPFHLTTTHGCIFVMMPSTVELMSKEPLEEWIGDAAQAVTLATNMVSSASESQSLDPLPTITIGLGGGLTSVIQSKGDASKAKAALMAALANDPGSSSLQLRLEVATGEESEAKSDGYCPTSWLRPSFFPHPATSGHLRSRREAEPHVHK